MVSSSVFGLEPVLDQIYAALKGYGYEVWMSHKGTMPTDPRLSNFDNCLKAVEKCDVFLGLITARYGSGREGSGRAITHREILRAIKKEKVRWFLVHRDVDVARQLLKQFRFHSDGSRRKLDFQPTPVLQDIRVLEMYEAALRHDLPPPRRTGNWVHPFSTPEDALRFIEAQFADVRRVRELLRRRSPSRRSK